MQTTTTATAVEETNIPLQETRIEVEPVSDVPTATDKKVEIGVIIAAVGCLSCCVVTVLMFALIIPILKLVIGRHYRDECPVQPKIPFFLYIGGIVGIITILAPVVANLLTMITTIKASKAAGETVAPKKSGLSRIINVVSILLSLFLFIWLICGAVWTFGVYNRVSYDATNQVNYCHKTLYRFTIVLLILAFLQTLIQCCSSGAGTKSDGPK